MSILPAKNCKHCGTPFLAPHNNPHKKYCSKKCAYNGWRKENPEKARETTRKNNAKWRAENPGRANMAGWRFRGIAGDFNLGLAAELWTGERYCNICGRTTGRFCIDHDHKTGKVRGLLCDDCNIGIGRFYENPDYLANAAAYLISHMEIRYE